MEKIKLVMLRHGATKGNTAHRYVGITDEELLPESRNALEAMRQSWQEETGDCIRLFVSPMLRARQTADILFPHIRQTVIEEFSECRFGAFEYKNYEELNGNPDYQRFIDSQGEAAFPDGESREEFVARTMQGFQKMLAIYCREQEKLSDESGSTLPTIVIVAHGGTLMAILHSLSKPHQDYFTWQTKNGCGFTGYLETEKGYAEGTDFYNYNCVRIGSRIG